MPLNMQSIGRAIAKESAGLRYALAGIKQRQVPTVGGILGQRIGERLAYERGRFGGSLLKKGVVNMAKRAGAPPDMIRKLENMDDTALEQMYELRIFDFETYFSYESHGAVTEHGYINLTQTNTEEIQKLLDAYERWVS